MTKENEESKEVVLNNDDLKNIVDFFTNFNIAIPEALKSDVDNYNANPSKFCLEDQNKIKVDLCAALVTADHELLRDELFKEVIQQCGDVHFEAEFVKNVEGALQGKSPEEIAKETQRQLEAAKMAREGKKPTP